MTKKYDHIVNPPLTLMQALTLKQKDCGWIRACMLEWGDDDLMEVCAHPEFGHVARYVLDERRVSWRDALVS